MSTQQLKKDPSMDEILASIREIISEDVKSISTARPVAPSRRIVNTPISQETGDILDLTDAVDDDLTRRTTTSYNKRRGEFMTYLADPKQGEALELSDEVSEKEYGDSEKQSTHTSPKKSTKRNPEIIESDDIDISEKIRESLAESDMISADALAQSSEALRALNDLDTGQDFYPTTSSKIEGTQTIEELMSNLLRPMLKNWLDANLPSIVKVIVSEQVEKVMKQRLK